MNIPISKEAQKLVSHWLAGSYAFVFECLEKYYTLGESMTLAAELYHELALNHGISEAHIFLINLQSRYRKSQAA